MVPVVRGSKARGHGPMLHQAKGPICGFGGGSHEGRLAKEQEGGVRPRVQERLQRLSDHLSISFEFGGPIEGIRSAFVEDVERIKRALQSFFGLWYSPVALAPRLCNELPSHDT